MERRSFLKTAGVGVAAGADLRPGDRPGAAGGEVAAHVELPQEPRHDLRRRRSAGQACRGHHRRQVRDPGLRRRRNRPGGRRSTPCRTAPSSAATPCSYYFFGKDPTFAFGMRRSVRPQRRQQNAWMYYGGGQKLLDEFYRTTTSSRSSPATPARRWAAGSARRSRRVADCKGVKMRIGGLGGTVLAELGMVPQQIPGGDIYPALEKGTIDAAEWVGPYDDEKLGFYKVAKNYYFPGWWEGGPDDRLLREQRRPGPSCRRNTRRSLRGRRVRSQRRR